MHVQSTVTEFSGKPGILSHVVTTMDSEVYDHDSSDKQNYVVCNNTDLTITPIPVVASVKHVKATVHYDREGSSEHDRPSNGNVYGENPSLNQPINDTECVASTSNERQLQQPQPLRQRSHDSLLMNSPQESQSNLSSALSLTDQTTSFKDNDGERISMEGSYMGQQHPTNLSASMPAGSNINHTQDGHASGEEIQTNQSQYVLSNQEYTWNQSSNHHGPQPSYFQHPVSIRYQVPPDLTCPHCGNRVKKKVFILHYPASYDCCGNIEDNPVLKLGVTLRRMDVDVTLDILECDHPPNSWPLWYEQNIYKSDVVLCVITENFYHNLINCELRNIIYQFCLRLKPAFRALFIDAKEKKMEYIPPFMRATTCYSVFSDKLIPSDEGFADLYAFLTSQNRFPKPKLGKILILSPRHRSHPSNNRDIQQNQAELILRDDATPVKSINTHPKMLMQLAKNMIADWEPLGRMLGVSDAKIYAVKVDYPDSVTERAVQMFNHWLMNYRSEATLGVLATAVYECGPQYWNLLDIINKYVPHNH